MIRKSRVKHKETSDDREADAISRLGPEPDVSNSARSIVDNSPLPMATLAGSNHILRYVNPAFCRLLSKTKDELTGKPFAEAVPWEGCLALLNRVYSTGEFAVQTEPGRTEAHPARRSYSVWALYGAEDHPAGLAMQVTETTQFQQRAIAVNEQLLLSGVRQHELIETAERLNAELQLEIAERKRMEQALVHSEKLAVTYGRSLRIRPDSRNRPPNVIIDPGADGPKQKATRRIGRNLPFFNVASFHRRVCQNAAEGNRCAARIAEAVVSRLAIPSHRRVSPYSISTWNVKEWSP
ncbi:MAG: PAS domain-containing protein [Acidobacteriaceae bacterium]